MHIAVGSGVFLDTCRLPVAGSVAVFRNRQEFIETHGDGWGPRGDSVVREKMEAHGIALLIFTAADFSVFGGPHDNPSTEIIMRHAQPQSTEVNTPRLSCLDDPSIGIRLFTGLDGTMPCVCEVRQPPRAAVNCDLSPSIVT